MSPFVVSLNATSIALTSLPPVEKITAILALFVATLSVKSKVGCCGSGTILLELHTDFSLFTYTYLYENWNNLFLKLFIVISVSFS